MRFDRLMYRGVVVAGLLLPTTILAADFKAEGQAAADLWDQTYNKGDIEALGKLYATDARVVPKGGAVSGRENIEKFFSGLKSKGFDGHKITVQAAKAVDNALVLTGRWEMSGPGEGGARKSFEGNWVNVMERQDNQWRTILHTWN